MRSPRRSARLVITWAAVFVLAGIAHTKLYYGTQLATWLEMSPPLPRTCPVPAARTAAAAAAPLTVAVLVLFDDKQGAAEARLSGFDELARRSIENKRLYCEAHGYSLIVADADAIDRSRPPAWSKLKALSEHLHLSLIHI